MDPLSALGLAAKVVTLLDFGFRVVNNSNSSREISKSIILHHVEYDDVIRTIEDVIRNMYSQNKSSQAARKGFKTFLPEESALQDMNKFYLEVVPVFQDILLLDRESRVQSSKYMSWQTNARKRRILARLEALRESWDKLLSAIHSEGNELIEDVRASLPTLRLDDFTRAAIEALLDQKLLLAATQLIEATRRCDVENGSPHIPSKTPEGQAIARANEAVCGSLQFEAMSNRTSTIAEPFANSCEWIFEEHDGKSTKLSKWLEHNDGLYLITGNEGSGKSTLMQYILNEPRTLKLLENWSLTGTSTLLTAAHFFWKSGTQLQRSEEGLLRSLIYSILKEKPEFTARILPREWAATFESFLHGSDKSVPGMAAWNLDGLWIAFHGLFHLPINILFLVDGLDEYQDTGNRTLAYINMIRRLTTGLVDSKNVKMLASSRPLGDLDSLGITPDINLHEANQEAISNYVLDVLEDEIDRKAAETDDDMHGPDIIDYLLSTASGSFLWTKLVVKMIQRQLSDGWTLRHIYQERNTRFPAGMPGIYQQLWSGTNSDQQTEASKILQIVLAGRCLKSSTSVIDESMRLVDLALAMGNAENVADMPMLPWPIGMIRRDCHRVLDRFTTVCQDFIRINGRTDIVSARIEFCHRSVLEFLERDDTEQLLSSRWRGCPYMPHLQSAVRHLKIMSYRLHKNPLPLLWVFAKSALLAANKIDSGKSSESPVYRLLIEALDATMQYHHDNICREREQASEYRGQYLESRIQDADETVEWRDRGRDYKRLAKMHWSNFHFDRGCSHPRDWKDSFLSLAVQFGLNNYVKRVLQKGGSARKVKKGRPLLNYALAPTPIAPYVLITPELVETLLTHGAKVGEKFKKKSCWENALRWQYETYVEVGSIIPRGSNSEERRLAENRAKIFLMLLKKDADKDASIVTSSGLTIPAKTVVERSFKSLASESTYQELQQFFSSNT